MIDLKTVFIIFLVFALLTSAGIFRYSGDLADMIRPSVSLMSDVSSVSKRILDSASQLSSSNGLIVAVTFNYDDEDVAFVFVTDYQDDIFSESTYEIVYSSPSIRDYHYFYSYLFTSKLLTAPGDVNGYDLSVFSKWRYFNTFEDAEDYVNSLLFSGGGGHIGDF